jgi:hypothetical protein
MTIWGGRWGGCARGGGVAGVPEGFDEGREGGVGAALEVEHASTSC